MNFYICYWVYEPHGRYWAARATVTRKHPAVWLKEYGDGDQVVIASWQTITGPEFEAFEEQGL